MANKRMIYQDFFEDEYFGVADPIIRLFWIGLITAVADDQGRLLDNSSLIRAKVFMYDRTITEEMIDEWLDTLNADNKIVRYQENGKHLIQIIKWWDYQTPAWASPSKYPAPENWIDRVRCHVSGPKQGGSVHTDNWDQDGGYHKELRSLQGSYQDKAIVKLSKVNDKLSSPDSDLFEDCKHIYEKKKGKLITDGKAFALMINNFNKFNVTVDDYSAAIDAMDADPKYKGDKPTSYEKWAIGYAEKRNNPINTNNGNPVRTVKKIGPDGKVIMEVPA